MPNPSDPPLSIVIVSRSLVFGTDGAGGMERAIDLHARALAAAGHEVRLIAPQRFVHGPLPAGLALIDVPWPSWDRVRRLGTFGAAYTLWTRRVGRMLEQLDSDIVHLHGASAGALRSAPRSATRAVANPHGMEEFGPLTVLNAPNRLATRRLARHAARAAAVVATDRALEPTVRRHVARDGQRVVVIPNVVDVDRLRQLAASDVRRGPQPTIVSVGRVVHNKGYDLLSDALTELGDDLPDGTAWHHYGRGPEAAALGHAARRHPRVPLTLHENAADDEVQGAIARAFVFVQPSRYEGSSLTTLEAMAHGVTVVGTAVGGIPDKITDGDTGFLAPYATASAIAEAVRRAAHSDGATGPAAKARVERDFSSATITEAYEALYRSVAGRI